MAWKPWALRDEEGCWRSGQRMGVSQRRTRTWMPTSICDGNASEGNRCRLDRFEMVDVMVMNAPRSI